MFPCIFTKPGSILRVTQESFYCICSSINTVAEQTGKIVLDLELYPSYSRSHYRFPLPQGFSCCTTSQNKLTIHTFFYHFKNLYHTKWILQIIKSRNLSNNWFVFIQTIFVQHGINNL